MLKELELFRLEKAQEDLIKMCTNIWREGAKRTETGSSQWCPVAGLKHTRSLWALETPLSLWGWHSTGTRGPEGWWRLLPWRYPKAIWTWSCTTSSGLHSLSWGVELEHSLSTLDTSDGLCFIRHPSQHNKPKIFYRTFTYRPKYPQLYAWEERHGEN